MVIQPGSKYQPRQFKTRLFDGLIYFKKYSIKLRVFSYTIDYQLSTSFRLFYEIKKIFWLLIFSMFEIIISVTYYYRNALEFHMIYSILYDYWWFGDRLSIIVYVLLVIIVIVIYWYMIEGTKNVIVLYLSILRISFEHHFTVSKYFIYIYSYRFYNYNTHQLFTFKFMNYMSWKHFYCINFKRDNDCYGVNDQKFMFVLVFLYRYFNY